MTVAINPKLKGKNRTKAIRSQQKRILREALKHAKETVMRSIDRLPEEWDGFELRWLLVATINQNGLHPDKRQRRREFENECAVRNLP